VPENEVELYDLDVVEGKEAVLKCKVAGLPYPTIAWFHNGKRIDSTKDLKMTQCELNHSSLVECIVKLSLSSLCESIGVERKVFSLYPKQHPAELFFKRLIRVTHLGV